MIMSTRPAAPAARPWSSACWPSDAEIVGVVEAADALDLRPRPAVDPFGVLLEVDRRQRDDLVVERDREALQEVLARRPGVEHGLVEAALGDPPGYAMEGLAAVVAELHLHERRARVRVGVRLGVLDVLAGQLRVVLDDREALDLRRLVRLPLLLDDHDPLGDLDNA